MKRDLSEALPIEEASSRFQKIIRRIRADGTSEFIAKCDDDVPSLCLFIWDELVHRGIAKNPYKIAPIIHDDYKGIYNFVQKEIGEAPVKDAFAEKVFNEHDGQLSFMDLSLVHCYPNDIHICDIELSDNSRPLEPNDPTREYRKFHGLNLFGIFVDNVKQIARSKGANRVSLMVAFPPLHDVFTRHGFRVSDTQMARAAHETVGRGHAMVIDL